MYIKVIELEKILKGTLEKQLFIKVQGLIDIDIEMKNIKIYIDKEKIWLISKNTRKIGINKHQIIKIDNDKENGIIKIKLDYLLDIYLIMTK